jgi:hypothetical protein
VGRSLLVVSGRSCVLGIPGERDLITCMASKEDLRLVILESHGLIADCQLVPTSSARHDDEDEEDLLLRRVIRVKDFEVEGDLI